MHDTGPNRPVTKLGRGRRAGVHEQDENEQAAHRKGEAPHEADRAAASAGADDAAGLVGRLPGGLGAHAPGVYASSGDVDKDGEVVGRLRPAIADGSAVDAEAQLAAVLRMLATAAAVRTAERASAGWSL